MLLIGFLLFAAMTFYNPAYPVTLSGSLSGGTGVYWCGVALITDDGQTYGSVAIAQDVAPAARGHNLVALVNEWDYVGAFGYDKQPGLTHKYIIEWKPPNTWVLTMQVFGKKSRTWMASKTINRTVQSRLHVDTYTDYGPCWYGPMTVSGRVV